MEYPLREKASRQLCVVVIEARPELAAITKRFLELRGHEVYCANDGHTGVELSKVHSPDVVTSSIEVPGLNGYEIAREITKRLNYKPRFVATTSYSKASIGQDLKEAGYDCFLAKPFRAEELVCTVEAELQTIPEQLRL